MPMIMVERIMRSVVDEIGSSMALSLSMQSFSSLKRPGLEWFVYPELTQMIPQSRAFTLSISTLEKQKQLPPRKPIPETDLDESFLRGSGPGGQKINKTSSAVQLKHLPSGIVVKCQSTRSRDQNRKNARRLLMDKLEVIEKGGESRVAIKAAVKAKRKASKTKKAKRKYKLLDEGKERNEEGQEEEDDSLDEGVDVVWENEEKGKEKEVGSEQDVRREGG
ncbi:hypothetical protein EJ08DRAFT_659225 [Tothia fuscella]|uniref:Prokaryotic-type class I peptide chain release factors domain-containing protein n=1 Tax=Tothia fuscella TaxID=1048955 RepID=A0A9P4NVS0_9PEZI|nr:hypothetical protein EJ08DRAFT_659225 [Tothia fuscella]